MSKKLAIIVPYRDREEHLEKFIPAIEEHLSKTDIDYQIWIIEQGNNTHFNKGRLMNAGFDLTSESFDYFCFHDVDLLPESSWEVGPENYNPPNEVAHLSKYVQQYGYRPQEPFQFIGGVALFTKDAFTRINGYSGGYWHWGAEDSDVYWRTQQRGIGVEQRRGKYISLPHKKRHGYSDPNDEPWGTKNMVRFGDVKRRAHHGEDVISGDGLSSTEYIVVGKRKWGRHVWVAIDFYDGEVESFVYRKNWQNRSPFFFEKAQASTPFIGGRRAAIRESRDNPERRFKKQRLSLRKD